METSFFCEHLCNLWTISSLGAKAARYVGSSGSRLEEMGLMTLPIG